MKKKMKAGIKQNNVWNKNKKQEAKEKKTAANGRLKPTDIFSKQKQMES